MIVSVSPLGSATGDAAGAATDVVRYLEGKCPARQGQDPGRSPDVETVDETTGVVGYYADATASPGIWMGHGLTGVHPDGMIDPAQLHRVLLGQHPVTGEQLMTANGSAQRAHPDAVKAALRGPDDDVLSLPEAAEALGVSASYLREQAAATAKARAIQARQIAAGETELAPLPSSHLDATQEVRHSPWKVTRAEARRFDAERVAPSVTLAYDLTFSVEKSVSLLWATANPAQRVVIEAAMTDAVRVGIAYMEENAANVRVSVRSDDGSRHLERQGATGLLAAAYLHETSRALDPQLHFHVVAANMAEGPDGAIRALDSNALFLHAKTAGYLSGAELRHRLSLELGVAWEPVHRGVADIEGVPRKAIVEMSQRSREMDEHIAGMDDHQPTTARGRQIAAYDTRAAKDAPVDPDALRPSWERRMAAAGFDRAAIDACYDRQPCGPQLVDRTDRQELFDLLGSTDGVTEFATTFDRRDVLQFVAQWGGDRLPVTEIERLADTWLTAPEIVRLENTRPDSRAADVIRRTDGRVVTPLTHASLYTTTGMIKVESGITSAYERGRTAGVGRVDPELVEGFLAARSFLGQDQVAMVRAITSSGRRIQLVQGDAGTGKTTALEAAARAFEAAGYNVIGSAVQGTATELVADKAKVADRTVASFLTRVAQGDGSIGPNTVVLVDECSTLGNRDLYHLGRALESTGAAAVLIGDPEQHSAVAAGGAWRRLLLDHPDEVVRVTTVRRQKGEEMEDVRQALASWRAGDIDAAVKLLNDNGRVVAFTDRDELLSAVVADWYGDRLARQGDPTLEASSMMAEYHRDRRELSSRARGYLVADGTLTGPVLVAGELQFQRGDEVMALEQDRKLRPKDATKRSDHVRTAERGVVLEVHLPKGDDPGSLLVDFAKRGPVEVPMEYLTRRLDRGINGALAHSYAVTTHAAQGDSYNAGRGIATDASSAKGVYVAITRSIGDLRMYFCRARDLDPAGAEHAEMPRLRDEADVASAVVQQLKAERDELLAREIDPEAGRVFALVRAHDLTGLDAMAASSSPDAALAARARHHREQAIAEGARLDPPGELIARIGARPAMGPTRQPWDDAVGRVAVYRARYQPTPVAEGAYVSWALGPVPEQAAQVEHYQVAGRALLAAEQAGLSRRSAAELAAERADLRSAMGPPADSEVRRARARHNEASTAVADAGARFDEATKALGAAQNPRLRRPNASRVEAAGVASDAALRSLQEAQANLRRSAERLAALEPAALAEARVPLQARLDRIDGAIADKVADAVANPAPYLTTALGQRPRDPGQRQRWNDAAAKLETWRQAELGLEPSAGALGSDGVGAALGPAPTDESQALRRQLAIKALPVEFQPQRTVERTMDGPALSID